MRKIEVTVTGPVGSGKSTVLEVIVIALRKAGYMITYKEESDHAVVVTNKEGRS